MRSRYIRASPDVAKLARIMQRFYRYAAQNGAFALSFSVLACLWTHRIFSSVEPEGGLEKVRGRPSWPSPRSWSTSYAAD